jgi:alkylation response protein AidB-like acyl-CoA dehydrogenase
MDFRHSDEQLAFYKSVRDFAAENVEPGAHERDVDGRFDRDLWAKLGQFGRSDFRSPRIMGAPVPTS